MLPLKNATFFDLYGILIAFFTFFTILSFLASLKSITDLIKVDFNLFFLKDAYKALVSLENNYLQNLDLDEEILILFYYLNPFL